MAHLYDMEELVGKIESIQIKNYVEEALSCYMAGAYRACVVLIYIALFDDIVKKLKELGKVNGKAKHIHDEIQKRMDSQDVYENYLIEQLKSNSLLPALDTDFLNTLRILRNKSAHPSGHNASAEEARFIFYESITRFLSRPILSTTQLVDDVLSRLDEQYFFPTLEIDNISAVVKKELKHIHTEAYPYCINKLLEKTLNTNADIKRNAGHFLVGLAYIQDIDTVKYIKKYILEKKCSDSKYSLLILRIISANSLILNDIDSLTYDRLRSILSNRIETVEKTLEHSKFSHPASVIISVLMQHDENFLIAHFNDQLLMFIEKNILSIYFINNISQFPKIIDIYVNVLTEKAGSSQFETANYVAKNIIDLEDVLSSFLSDKNAFILILKFIESADHGAWHVASLRSNKFSAISKIADMARKYLKNQSEDVKKLMYQMYEKYYEEKLKSVSMYLLETESE